jgi:hypothetical protein
MTTLTQTYAEPVALRDGTSLLLRAVRPSDKPLVLALFGRLSPQSIRYRAFGGKSTLTKSELSALTEVDFHAHVALVAVVRTPAEERLVGVGRYFRIDTHGKLDASRRSRRQPSPWRTPIRDGGSARCFWNTLPKSRERQAWNRWRPMCSPTTTA